MAIELKRPEAPKHADDGPDRLEITKADNGFVIECYYPYEGDGSVGSVAPMKPTKHVAKSAAHALKIIEEKLHSMPMKESDEGGEEKDEYAEKDKGGDDGGDGY